MGDIGEGGQMTRLRWKDASQGWLEDEAKSQRLIVLYCILCRPSGGLCHAVFGGQIPVSSSSVKRQVFALV